MKRGDGVVVDCRAFTMHGGLVPAIVVGVHPTVVTLELRENDARMIDEINEDEYQGPYWFVRRCWLLRDERGEVLCLSTSG